jgi:hypothetical protein
LAAAIQLAGCSGAKERIRAAGFEMQSGNVLRVFRF